MEGRESRDGRGGGRQSRSYQQNDDGMDMGGDSSKKFMGGGHQRKKACKFCTDPDFTMDYKNTRIMQSFLTEHGKIVPRRISGCCAHHQRKLTSEIKRARNLALVGFVSLGN